MKHNFIRVGSGISALITIVLIVTSGFLMKPAMERAKLPGKGFAVVELFTSEGCSSCPAADAEAERISGLMPGAVYVLGFHVDYWNRLGWKDAFSDAAYSERQRGYADKFNLNSVYTPQVVVNGKEQLVGSDATLLRRTVDSEIKNTGNHAIELSAAAPGGKTVRVTFKLEAPVTTVVNIALIQVAAQTNVKLGENEGRTLRHINIVRDFKTINKSGPANSVDLTLPNGLLSKECKVIIYLQEQQTREITAVAAAFIKSND